MCLKKRLIAVLCPDHRINSSFSPIMEMMICKITYQSYARPPFQMRHHIGIGLITKMTTRQADTQNLGGRFGRGLCRHKVALQARKHRLGLGDLVALPDAAPLGVFPSEGAKGLLGEAQLRVDALRERGRDREQHHGHHTDRLHHRHERLGCLLLLLIRSLTRGRMTMSGSSDKQKPHENPPDKYCRGRYVALAGMKSSV